MPTVTEQRNDSVVEDGPPEEKENNEDMEGEAVSCYNFKLKYMKMPWNYTFWVFVNSPLRMVVDDLDALFYENKSIDIVKHPWKVTNFYLWLSGTFFITTSGFRWKSESGT